MKKPKFKIHFIPLSKIAPNPDQRPLDEQKVAMLVKDIERRGLQYPITVFPLEGNDTYSHQLAVGGHRYSAFMKLERETIPAYMTTAVKAKSLAAAENLLRSSLDYLQQAESMKVLASDILQNPKHKSGSPSKGIKPLSRELGESPRTIGRLLAVARLEPRVRALAREQGMANDATFLYALAKLDNRADRIRAIHERTNGSKRKTEKISGMKRKLDESRTNKMAWRIRFTKLEKLWNEAVRKEFVDAERNMKVAFIRKIFDKSLIKQAAELNG